MATPMTPASGGAVQTPGYVAPGNLHQTLGRGRMPGVPAWWQYVIHLDNLGTSRSVQLATIQLKRWSVVLREVRNGGSQWTSAGDFHNTS